MKKIIVFLIVIICLIVICLNSCIKVYYTTKVVEKKKIVGKINKYKLQKYIPDEILYNEFNPTNIYFKLITRNDSIEKFEFYIHDRIILFKKNIK